MWAGHLKLIADYPPSRSSGSIVMNGDRKHLTEEDGRGDTRWSLEEGRLKHARALIQFKIGIMLAFYA